MPSVAVRVNKQDDMVQIQFDIIYLNFFQHKESLKSYLDSDGRAYNLHGVIKTTAEHKEFIMCDNKNTNIVDEYVGEFATITVPNDAAVICELLLVLEEYFQIYHKNQSYYVGLGANAIVDHFTNVKMLNTSLSAIIHEWTKSYPMIHQLVEPYLASSAKEMPILTKFTDDYVRDMKLHDFDAAADTKQLIIADYLATEIAKMYPPCQFLRAIKLLDPLLSSEERSKVLNELKGLINDQVIEKDIAKITLNYLTMVMKNQFINSCVNKKGPNGASYQKSDTELNLLRRAVFALEEDGRISIDLTKNEVYKYVYAKGRRLHGNLEKELKHLAQYLHLEFDKETDFLSRIVFTKESSCSLLSKGVALRNQFFSEAEFAQVEEAEELAKVVATEPMSALPGALFNPYVISIKPTAIDNVPAVSLRQSQ